jgi:hypothetical protein
MRVFHLHFWCNQIKSKRCKTLCNAGDARITGTESEVEEEGRGRGTSGRSPCRPHTPTSTDRHALVNLTRLVGGGGMLSCAVKRFGWEIRGGIPKNPYNCRPQGNFVGRLKVSKGPNRRARGVL